MSRGDIDQWAGRADAARGPGGAEPSEEESAAAAAVLQLIWGTQMARAVYVMAKLGIADLLAGGPLTAAQLAQATQAHEPSLYRVLRLSALLEMSGWGCLAFTRSGPLLRRRARGRPATLPPGAVSHASSLMRRPSLPR